MLPAGAPGSTPGCVRARALAVGIALAGLVCGAAGCGSDNDPRPARWSFISATITEPSCATVSCHSNIANTAAVDLASRATGYNDLVNRHFVIPYNPDTSPLMFLLTAQGSQRMPPDLPLPFQDIQLISRWIANGANND
jgi:hypothetical protein